MATRTYQVRCAGGARWTRTSCFWEGRRQRKIHHGQPIIASDPLAKPCPNCGSPVYQTNRP